MHSQKKHVIRKSIIGFLIFSAGIASTVFAAVVYDANIQSRADKIFSTIKSNASTMNPLDVSSYYALVRMNVSSLVQVLMAVDDKVALESWTAPWLDIGWLLGSITGTGKTSTGSTSGSSAVNTGSIATGSTNINITGTTTNLSLEDTANAGISQDFCWTKYEPVCWFMQVPSSGTATKEIRITFTNICYANYRKATGIISGACQTTSTQSNSTVSTNTLTGNTVTGANTKNGTSDDSGNNDNSVNAVKTYVSSTAPADVISQWEYTGIFHINTSIEYGLTQLAEKECNTKLQWQTNPDTGWTGGYGLAPCVSGSKVTVYDWNSWYGCVRRSLQCDQNAYVTDNARSVVVMYKSIYGREPDSLTLNRYLGDANSPDFKQRIIDGEKSQQAWIDKKLAHEKGLLVQSDCAWWFVVALDQKSCVDPKQVPTATAYSNEQIKTKNFAIHINRRWDSIDEIAIYDDNWKFLETIQYQIGTIRDVLKKYNIDRQQLADLDSALRASYIMKSGQLKTSDIIVPEYNQYGIKLHDSNLTNLIGYLAPEEENTHIGRVFAISSMYQTIFPNDLEAYNSNIRTYWENSTLSLNEIEQLLLKKKADLAAAQTPTQKNLIDRTQKITDLYRSVLGKEPDAEGLKYWVNDTLTVAEIRTHFEWLTKTPTPAGQTNTITSTTDSTKTRDDESAKEKLASIQLQQANIALELRKNQIIGLYSSILGRSSPDEAGLNYWINDPMSIDQIRETFKQVKAKTDAAAAEQEQASQEQQTTQVQTPIPTPKPITNQTHPDTSVEDIIKEMYANNPTAMKYNPNGADQSAIDYWKWVIAEKWVSAVQNTIFPNMVKEVDANH